MADNTSPAPGLAIVILNLNGWDVLRDCLLSLRDSLYPDFVAIVVDNGSTDGSPRKTREGFPEAVVIETGSNLGFTGGNNVGIQCAMKMGARAFLLLNNDTIIDSRCLSAMMAALDADPRVGAVTPKILFHDRRDRIWSAGGDYTLWKGIAKHRGLRAPADDPRFARPCDVTFATGCALCVRRELVEKIGVLDDNLFIYNEDTDYSVRVLRAGYRILYVPNAVLWHREGWDSRRATGQKRRLHLCTRNILMVHRKHRSWYHLPVFAAFFAWRWVLLAGLNALRRGDRATVAGILSGIRAYARGEKGAANVS